jgi:uncharacterized protein (DUF305 family)
MRPTTLLLAAVLAGGLGISTVAAQEEEHGEHHEQPVTGSEEVAPMPMAPGAMMGQSPGMMQRCMEMMPACRPGQAGMDGAEDGHTGLDVSGPLDPVEGAFDAINRRMHRDMAVVPGSNPDMAFAKGMIAHHIAAVDMARVVLSFGKDPEIRKLAEAIIKAQEPEIAFLQQWLLKQPQQ